MKSLILSLLISTPFFVHAQTNDEKAIRAVVERLFEGMRKSDSSIVRSAFAEGAILQGVKDDQAGFGTASANRIDGFLKAVAAPKKEAWNEQITDPVIHVSGNLASVWATYTFHLGSKLHHCGIDSFQLVKGKDGWRIVYLIDTQTSCSAK